jgi:hypothetical protein
MDAIPEHSQRMADRLLAGYCARICPPRARHAVLLDFQLERDRATLFELRPICGVPGTRQRVPLAQFCWRGASEAWHLRYVAERERSAAPGPRWRRYTPLPRARSLLELLRELDADPRGLFWPRIDGKSLRWCSSRGRCADCDHRYCAVLGLSAGAGLRGDAGDGDQPPARAVSPAIAR